MEGNLLVGFVYVKINVHACWIFLINQKVYFFLQMRTLNWIIMGLAFSLWQIVVQTQMGLSSL